jgi:hypothetical protein
MALNNCFNSPTCTSMTEHLGGIGSPAEGLSLVPEVFVIGSEYAIVPGSRTCSAGRASESLFVIWVQRALRVEVLPQRWKEYLRRSLEEIPTLNRGG